MKITAAVTGVGAYVPDYVLTNQELEKMVDTTDDVEGPCSGAGGPTLTAVEPGGGAFRCSTNTSVQVPPRL